MIRAYTDGACRGNPGPGGWGVIIDQGGERLEFFGADRATTNNRMELTAAISALEQLPAGVEVEVHSDSRYVVDGMREWVPNWRRRNWRKSDNKPVLNKDLWQRLVEVAETRKVKWIWVEGHAGHAENERADDLANQAIDELNGNR